MRENGTRIRATEFRDAAGVPSLCLDGAGDYDLALTFDCGQCFRFEPAGGGRFEGVAFGRVLTCSSPAPGRLILHGCTNAEYEAVWRSFLALDRDWRAIYADAAERSPVFAEAIGRAGGIRILRQEPFETLITFVLSQCNNIPRIKSLVSALASAYGEPVRSPDGRIFFSFPSSARLAAAPEEELRALKLGYRAEFVREAAKAAEAGLLLRIAEEKDTGRALGMLTEIRGVGEKVASCALLFGFGRLDAFPRDVWIRRAMERLFPGVKDPAVFGPYAGVCQQLLFFCERYGRDRPLS